jgi:hypothetical protein
VNREAELRAPSRVGCSDLLGIVMGINFLKSSVSAIYELVNGQRRKTTAEHKPDEPPVSATPSVKEQTAWNRAKKNCWNLPQK